MGLQTVPAYIGQAAYQHPVELDRNILEGIFARTGLMRLGDFALAPTGVAQQLSISAGRAFLLGAESAQQGGYVAWSDVSENKVFGPPSGSARIDSLILRVVDTQYGSDPGSPRAEWDIVAGVPSGSPVARVDSDFNTGGTFYKPGAWWRAADVRINVGDTVIPGGQVTRYLRYTRQSRGSFLALSTDTVTDMSVGDSRYDTDTLTERVWNGSVWDNVLGPIIEMGNVTAGVAATSVGAAEAAIPTATWAHEPNMTFRAGHIYKVELQFGLGINASSATSMLTRIRKGAQTVAGQILASFIDGENDFSLFMPHFHIAWIKNATAANITSALSLTVQRTSASNNASLYGDSTIPLQITIQDMGLQSGHPCTGIASSIV